MTSKIETTRLAMYDAFHAMKDGGRWLIKKANCEAFESALEEHLEATRQDLAEMTRLRECFETLAVDYTKKSVSLEESNKSLDAWLGYALNDREVYSDAYTLQKELTQKACVREREIWDRLQDALSKAAVYGSDCQRAEQLSDDRYERIQELMELVESQRQAYAALYRQKFSISPAQDAANVLKTKAEALAIIRGDGQSRLEAVNRTLVAQVEELTRELDVLKDANRIAGEELREEKSKWRLDSVGFLYAGDDGEPDGTSLYFPRIPAESQ